MTKCAQIGISRRSNIAPRGWEGRLLGPVPLAAWNASGTPAASARFEPGLPCRAQVVRPTLTFSSYCLPAWSHMEGPLKELTKLQKLVSDSSSSKGKSPSINDSLDSLLQSLQEVKDRLQHGTATDETLTILSKTVETRKKEVDERQKEVYNALAKIGKALDKVRLY